MALNRPVNGREEATKSAEREREFLQRAPPKHGSKATLQLLPRFRPHCHCTLMFCQNLQFVQPSRCREEKKSHQILKTLGVRAFAESAWREQAVALPKAPAETQSRRHSDNISHTKRELLKRATGKQEGPTNWP